MKIELSSAAALGLPIYSPTNRLAKGQLGPGLGLPIDRRLSAVAGISMPSSIEPALYVPHHEGQLPLGVAYPDTLVRVFMKGRPVSEEDMLFVELSLGEGRITDLFKQEGDGNGYTAKNDFGIAELPVFLPYNEDQSSSSTWNLSKFVDQRSFARRTMDEKDKGPIAQAGVVPVAGMTASGKTTFVRWICKALGGSVLGYSEDRAPQPFSLLALSGLPTVLSEFDDGTVAGVDSIRATILLPGAAAAGGVPRTVTAVVDALNRFAIAKNMLIFVVMNFMIDGESERGAENLRAAMDMLAASAAGIIIVESVNYADYSARTSVSFRPDNRKLITTTWRF